MNKKLFFGIAALVLIAAVFAGCIIDDELPTYIVIFDANGADGEPYSQKITYGENIRLKSIEDIGFTHPNGLHFAGWMIQDDREGGGGQTL